MSNDQVKRVDVCRPDNWSRNEITLGACPPGPFTTIAQHESIVAALLQHLAGRDAEIERLKEQKDKFMWQVRDTCTRAEAAEARVRELERDATRLDWLQDHLLGEGSADKFGLDHPEWSDSLEWSDIPEGESLRHIVDAAMASEGGGDANLQQPAQEAIK